VGWLKRYVEKREREAREVVEKIQQRAYISLNNLYLELERGDYTITIFTGNRLRMLVSQAYDPGDFMIDHWEEEFYKLPGWFDV